MCLLLTISVMGLCDQASEEESSGRSKGIAAETLPVLSVKLMALLAPSMNTWVQSQFYDTWHQEDCGLYAATLALMASSCLTESTRLLTEDGDMGC